MTLVADRKAVRRFTRDEYYRMAEAGPFKGQRVELINGEIIRMSPQANPHARSLMLITRLFMRRLSDDFSVRPQLPLAIDEDSEPEPDVAVVQESPQQLSKGHPSTAQLVIEISDSSLLKDRQKAALYARARIPEYWIVNLRTREIEVHTQPNSKSGKYLRRRTVRHSETIRPVALSIGLIEVMECFAVS